jgi:hypothetical protein
MVPCPSRDGQAADLRQDKHEEATMIHRRRMTRNLPWP